MMIAIAMVLVIFKLAGVIAWTWWLVLLPVWLWVAYVGGLVVLGFIVGWPSRGKYK